MLGSGRILAPCVAMLAIGCGLVGGRSPHVHNVNHLAFEGPELSVVTMNLLFSDPLGGDGEEAGETLTARLHLIEQELIATQPDIVALQEVSISRPHGDVLAGLAERLNQALSQEGIRYNWVYSSAHVDPTGLTGFEEGEGLLSRYEIVAARDLVYDAQGAILSLCGIPLLRESRKALHVTIRGRDDDLDVVATHLFPGRGKVNDDQVAELLETIAPGDDSGMKLVLGDLNSTPDSPAIGRLRDAGFVDAWPAANPDGPPGWTYGHLPLSSRAAAASERIDYIFVHGARVRNAELFLDRAIPSPSASEPDRWLWASDHSGVTATVVQEGSGSAGRTVRPSGSPQSARRRNKKMSLRLGAE